MKQVKKLLVILPLVALFVLGSLPVLAAETNLFGNWEKLKFQLTTTPTEGAMITTKETVFLKDVLDRNGFEAKFVTEDEGKTGTDAQVEPLIKQGLAKLLQGKGLKAKEAELIAAATQIAKNLKTAKDADDNDIIKWTLATTEINLNVEKVAAEPGKKPGEKTEEKPAASSDRQLVVEYYANRSFTQKHPTEATRTYTLKNTFFEDGQGHVLSDDFANVRSISAALREFIFNQQQNSYLADLESFNTAAQTFLRGGNTATVRLYEQGSNRRRVIAYDIHNNQMAFDQVAEVELNEDYESTVGIVEAFYNHSSIRRDYILVGYIENGGDPHITASIASLERINERVLRRTMNSPYVQAEYAALVVPNTINVPVEHIFPEGTRPLLRETVGVPYETWVTLQNTWKLVDIPSIFRTRIQKVNEEGYTFRSMEYFNGENKITGLVASWDWANYPMGGDRNGGFVARVFYDRAVAAAKEVPSEKKVDAATAPQAQIKAPAGQAPVTAANTTTTTAPANTLPVTGASDSIFLFLSSAALMAVGILFFKKH